MLVMKNHQAGFKLFSYRLPTPTGYGSNHVLRNLTDNEWRKIIIEIKKTGFSILSDAYGWKTMTNKAGVSVCFDFKVTQ